MIRERTRLRVVAQVILCSSKFMLSSERLGPVRTVQRACMRPLSYKASAKSISSEDLYSTYAVFDDLTVSLACYRSDHVATCSVPAFSTDFSGLIHGQSALRLTKLPAVQIADIVPVLREQSARRIATESEHVYIRARPLLVLRACPMKHAKALCCKGYEQS